MASSPRACIIGAGSSGITEVQALHKRSIPFDYFEKSGCIGGNWAYGNKNGRSVDYLRGAYALPEPGPMRSAMDRDRAAMFRRYAASRRHTLQVDADDYLYDKARERAAGGERARHGTGRTCRVVRSLDDAPLAAPASVRGTPACTGDDAGDREGQP